MFSTISSKCRGLMLALAFATLPAYAHHGWSGNEDEQFEITGTVETPLRLSGPHATMQIRAEGKVWDITLAPPPRTKRAGLEEGTIPVGATVTVSGHRNNNPERFEIKTERVTYNGKTYNVYPDRE
jgi:Family of unknown function (DUF6152)